MSTEISYQAEISKFRTALEKLSKKKLIDRIVALTVECANLQADVDNLFIKLKERGDDKHLHSDDKKGKGIITTD